MSSNQYYNPPPGPPPSQNSGGGYGSNNNNNNTPTQGAPYGQHQHQQQQQPYQTQQQAPGYPPRPANTGAANPALNPTGSDRAEQIETLQSYEGSGHQNEHDRNREQLQREFPNVDGSLIAALYGDSESMAATREVLMELGDGK